MLDELDLLINDVAKTMTEAPAREGVARRVAARIADEGERRSWFRPWVMVPIAAACVVAVAVFVAREGSVPEVLLKPDTTETATTKAATTEVRLKPDTTTAFVPARVARGPQRAALQAVEPIEVDRLDVQPLVEMDVIQITPIAIDRIEIAAMP